MASIDSHREPRPCRADVRTQVVADTLVIVNDSQQSACMVQVENQTRNKMNTYYIKQDNGAFAEVTFSDGMLITMLTEKLVKDALWNASAIINERVNKRVSEEIDKLNIAESVQNVAEDLDMEDMVKDSIESYLDNVSWDLRVC